MKWLAAAFILIFSTAAQSHTTNNNQNWFWFQPSPVKQIAHIRHHYHHFVAVRRHTYSRSAVIHSNSVSGLVTIATAANPITIAANLASQFKGFIDDLVAAGYHAGNVHCFAPTGHIRNSLHHIGAACDFAQTGWDRAPAIMHTQMVTELAHKYGLRSGCEFRSRRDCGHIDAGFTYHRYASSRHHQHYTKAALTAFARANGPQWSDQPINIKQWFQALMQPDNPMVSCCGEADAYEADTYEAEGDHYIAIVTNGKGVIPDGTKIPVPNSKMKWDQGNPTGHGILFIGQNGTLYCYVTPSGI